MKHKHQSGKLQREVAKYEPNNKHKQQSANTKTRAQIVKSKENNPNDKFTKKIIKVRWRRTPKHK
jgi:hypothetical protein